MCDIKIKLEDVLTKNNKILLLKYVNLKQIYSNFLY